MNIIKKLSRIVTGYKEKEVESAEAWIVSWKARYGIYSSDYEMVCKVFLNEEDAETFAQSLKFAANLLQYTEEISIYITKQKG